MEAVKKPLTGVGDRWAAKPELNSAIIARNGGKSKWKLKLTGLPWRTSSAIGC